MNYLHYHEIFEPSKRSFQITENWRKYLMYVMWFKIALPSASKQQWMYVISLMIEIKLKSWIYHIRLRLS